MKRAHAEQLTKTLKVIGDGISQLTEEIESLSDVEEQKTLRQIAGKMLASHFDLVEKITSRFPDLDPDSDN